MRELTEVRALLARLDEVEADALESQDLDFKEWPADDRHAIRLAVDMAVCIGLMVAVRAVRVSDARAVLGLLHG